jgi:putative addiction module component (TIGR02574 family)
MAKPFPSPPPEFDKLPVDKQIDYVQSLWDRIAASPEQVPVPEWHRRVIRERLEAYNADSAAGRLWSEVRTDIEKNCGIVDLTDGAASHRPAAVRS